jgi:uncharacterized protein (DUF885 family)
MTEVSRDEFAMLREQVATVERRLDEIDRIGTRGVAVLAVQVSELSKDMGGMQTQMTKHQQEHEADARARVTGRRWAIGLAAVLFAAVESPLVTLLLTRR